MDCPQFFDGGPQILVKNTFLDITDDDAESLAPPPLARARTAPSAPVSRPERDEEESGVPEAIPETDSSEGEDDAPPATLSLTRCITKDWYEEAHEWQWANNASSTTAGMMPNAAMAGMPVGQPAMVYVPVMMPVMPIPEANPSPSGPSGRGYGGQTSPVVAESTPESTSSPCNWPPPPPELAPEIERVPSGSGPAPQFSPAEWSAKAAAERAAQLMAFADDDEAGEGGKSVAASADAAPPAPQPQTLTRAFSISSCTFRIHWHVDARKLRGNDKQAVSPPFELSFGSQFPNVTFKMMIYPKAVNDSKGGASFKKAKGKGYIQLKCEAELSEAVAQVKFRIGIGSGALTQTPRGPQVHNFSQSAVCGLPKDQEEWDFNAVVDQDSMTFLVVLEIVPQGAGG